jgi:glycerol uptake facilitator-like aquaporin
MAERLSAGNLALALLVNAIATGGALVALILCLAPISGAHINPAVTLVEFVRRRVAGREAFWYVTAQLLGALAGVAIANLLFGLSPLVTSHHGRGGPIMMLSEFIATAGLVLTILGSARRTPNLTAFAIASYIVAAYWFTPSTSFANPAVTIARSLTDTFTGILPNDVLPFIVAQTLGALAAAYLFAWLIEPEAEGPRRTTRDIA